MAAEYPHLYPYSRADARSRKEMAEWKQSFERNVECARGIEAAIRSHFENETISAECAKSVLDEYGFKRVNFVLANSVKQMGTADLLAVDNLRWARKQYVPNDGRYNRYFAVDTAALSLDAFIRQARAAYQELGMFGVEHCPGDRSKQDYTGKVLVLSSDTLREGCWSPENQLWYAHDGFGCNPNAIGRSIRATCLGDGEMTRWNRADFIGVLDEKYLPDWAMDRLSALRAAEQERQAVRVPPTPSIYTRMANRITEFWAIYEAEMLQLPAREIFAKAEEIAAARFCRDELTENVKIHSEDLLEYLILTDNPLEAMREQWLDEQAVDHHEEFEHALWNMKERYFAPEQSTGDMRME